MKSPFETLLLIFTRNPELGKCKTRLAAKVGDHAALDVYKFLLNHTVDITINVSADKHVYYSEEIWENDIWDEAVYQKKLQQGATLGERMARAFDESFKLGYQRIIIIGSDMYDLSQKDLDNAFDALKKHNFVIGPAEDGGYYLLGMRKPKPELFESKAWGEASVFEATMKDLENEDCQILATRNDVDYYEDIAHIEAFHPFLKHIKK